MRKLILAAVAVLAVIAVPLVYFLGGGTSFKVDNSLRSEINACVASQAGSGKQGIPFASTEIVSAKKKSGGAVAYALARIQSFSDTGNGAIEWSTTAYCRISLVKNAQTGIYSVDYCMFPRSDSYEEDFEMMFPKGVRRKLTKLASNQELLNGLDDENADKASDYIAAANESNTYAAAMTACSGNEGFTLWTGLLVKSAGDLFFTVNVQNTTEGVLCFGSAYKLERKEDSVWKAYDVKEGYSFSKGVTAVSAGEAQELLYNFNAYTDAIVAGEYRLTGEYFPSTETTSANIHRFSVEFTVSG